MVRTLLRCGGFPASNKAVGLLFERCTKFALLQNAFGTAAGIANVVGVRPYHVRSEVVQHSLAIGRTGNRVVQTAAVNLVQTIRRLRVQIREVVFQDAIKIVFKYQVRTIVRRLVQYEAAEVQTLQRAERNVGVCLRIRADLIEQFTQTGGLVRLDLSHECENGVSHLVNLHSSNQIRAPGGSGRDRHTIFAPHFRALGAGSEVVTMRPPILVSARH